MEDSWSRLETPRCPKCGAHLVIHQQTDTIWCTFVTCSYGLFMRAKLVHGLCVELKTREVRLYE
jgi:DNA-directed RNA polymerase subunit RPC12/RpoP